MNCQQANGIIINPFSQSLRKLQTLLWDRKTCQVTQRDGDLEKSLILKQSVCVGSCLAFLPHLCTVSYWHVQSNTSRALPTITNTQRCSTHSSRQNNLQTQSETKTACSWEQGAALRRFSRWTISRIGPWTGFVTKLIWVIGQAFRRWRIDFVTGQDVGAPSEHDTTVCILTGSSHKNRLPHTAKLSAARVGSLTKTYCCFYLGEHSH